MLFPLQLLLMRKLICEIAIMGTKGLEGHDNGSDLKTHPPNLSWVL